MRFKRAVFKSGGSLRVAIPMEVVNALGIKEYDFLDIWVEDGEIVMKKAQPMVRTGPSNNH